MASETKAVISLDVTTSDDVKDEMSTMYGKKNNLPPMLPAKKHRKEYKLYFGTETDDFVSMYAPYNATQKNVKDFIDGVTDYHSTDLYEFSYQYDSKWIKLTDNNHVPMGVDRIRCEFKNYEATVIVCAEVSKSLGIMRFLRDLDAGDTYDSFVDGLLYDIKMDLGVEIDTEDIRLQINGSLVDVDSEILNEWRRLGGGDIHVISTPMRHITVVESKDVKYELDLPVDCSLYRLQNTLRRLAEHISSEVEFETATHESIIYYKDSTPIPYVLEKVDTVYIKQT